MSDEAQLPSINVNMAEALGADPAFSMQCFTVYLPNKDKKDREFGTQRKWVLEAIQLLSAINGGATAIPVEGGWVNDDGELILEEPVVVYSYVADTPKFIAELPRLREFLHRLGRDTNQGEVAFEFNGEFYRIRTFDQP